MRTVWSTPDIWLRRSFDLPAGFTATNPKLSIHHDEAVEVHINGVLALKAGGYSTDYELAALTPEGGRVAPGGSN